MIQTKDTFIFETSPIIALFGASDVHIIGISIIGDSSGVPFAFTEGDAIISGAIVLKHCQSIQVIDVNIENHKVYP